MSLYLPEQKLGSHSQEDSNSHKFMLKGRQTGAMHRGHSWVFRAESHETMMSWYEDIEGLISKTGEARNAFVRQHVRSVSGRSMASEVMDDDEADRTPYAAGSAVLSQDRPTSSRQAGGAFPSDVQIDRQAPLSPSSGDSSAGRDLLAAAGSFPDGSSPFDHQSPQAANRAGDDDSYQVYQSGDGTVRRSSRPRVTQHDSYYGDWMGSAAVAKQQQQPQEVDFTPDERDVRSDGDQASLAAISGAGFVDRRDHSAPPQVTGRESVSTAPTNTNMTEHTNHTNATSMDEPLDYPKTLPPGLQNGSATHTMIAPELRSKKDSIVGLDMKIPGHYPTTNVAA